MSEDHEVQQGDCVNSIAFEHGFFWETLWKHPNNAALREKRNDPNVLKEGDLIHIPDLTRKEESGATEQCHRFRRKGTPAILRVQILRPVATEGQQPEDAEAPLEEPPADEPLEVAEEDALPPDDMGEEPWANAPYVLDVDGKLTDGQTDEEGKLEVPIPPTAREGRLTMEPGTAREKAYGLRLGHLDPLASATGIADRLNNLGFHDGSRPAEMTPGLREALRAFQKANGLADSAEPDQPTRDKLRDLHGS